jgi:YD repeat-containing protein
MPVITYLYDECQRLIGVADPDGHSSGYRYDALGNIRAVRQGDPSNLSILDFTPKHGSEGTSVTVLGTGFSTVLSENRVTLNNMPAAVLSAAANQIIVRVPPGTSGGRLTVSTPVGSVTSLSGFTVDPPIEPPAIAGFDPTIAVPGASVTIAGRGLTSTLASSRVRFNETYGLVISEAESAITASVPNGAGSGRISVITPFGSAVAGEDFFIPPAPRLSSDVEVTGRIEIGQAQTITISAPQKVALLLFAGVRGQRLRLDVTSVSLGPQPGLDTTLSIIKPDGQSLISQALLITTAVHLGPVFLPEPGTYTVLVDSATSSAVTMNLALQTEPLDLLAAITIGGSPVSLQTSAPGQGARVTFDGSAGQLVSLGVNRVAIADTGSGFTVSIVNPLGTQIVSAIIGQLGDSISATLPLSGTSAVTVVPIDRTVGDATLTLSEPITETLEADGRSVPLAITRSGQSARLSFEGAANQEVSLGMTGVGFTGGARGAITVSVLNPDGTLLATQSFGTSGEGISAKLITPGRYTVVCDIHGSAGASLTLTLSRPLDDALVLNGPTVVLNPASPGQNSHISFTAAAGDTICLGVGPFTFGIRTIGFLEASILNPDGTTLRAATLVAPAGRSIAVESQLLVTGTYSIFINSHGAQAVGLAVTLSETIAAALTIDGAPAAVSLKRLGQNARLSFTALEGQRVRCIISEVLLGPSAKTVDVTVVGPDRLQVASDSFTETGGTLETPSLAVGGVCTVEVVASGSSTADLTLAVKRLI